MSQFVRRTPDGDTHARDVCTACGYVAYENPKIVVGSVVAQADQVLLCRRAIEPRKGFWTLPAGYLELQETTEEGACREAMEEAGAAIELDGVLAVFNVSRIGQVQIMYRARFAPGAPAIAAGVESLEVAMFAWEDIPWREIAFPTVVWALNVWRDGRHSPLAAPAGNPPQDARGVQVPGQERPV